MSSGRREGPPWRSWSGCDGNNVTVTVALGVRLERRIYQNMPPNVKIM